MQWQSRVLNLCYAKQSGTEHWYTTGRALRRRVSIWVQCARRPRRTRCPAILNSLTVSSKCNMLCSALNKYFISQKCSGKRWGRFFNAQKVGPYPQIAGTAQFQLELISLTLKHILTIGKYEARIRTQRV